MIGKSLLLSGCIILPCTIAFAGCEKPPEIAPSSAVELPDYRGATDETPDPEEVAAQKAWRGYQESIFEVLSRSPNPRDWALATLVQNLQFDVGNPDANNHGDLLQRATREAPDDVLVQWVAMNSGGAVHDKALHRLHELEPENGAVWMEDLAVATKRKDNAGIGAALAKISSSQRFDTHFTDLLKHLTEVFSQNPVPDSYRAAASKEGFPSGKDSLAYATAMTVTVTAAAAIPSFQNVVNACRIDPASGTNSSRAADCAAIGKLMTKHGDTLIANRIGASVLRVSRTYTDEDMQVARDLDWIYQRATEQSAADFTKQYHDWIETGSEVESIRRSLVRAGIAPMPPEHWLDTWSLFSAERLRNDAEWFEKNEKK